jgi:hypothetical protein
MAKDLGRTIGEGLLLSAGYMMTSFFISVSEVGGLSLVRWAHRFLQMNSSFIFGPFLTWIWGWGAWWVNVFILLAWLGGLFWFGYRVWEK